jgi:pimeloyl-ACP methyl ester carboxylesterase
LLAAQYNVFMPDLPGFGASEKPGRSLDIPELADSLGDWMLANELEQAILMGNSMGCQVIAELAAQRPGVARRVVFTGPSIDRRRRSMFGQIANAVLDVIHEPPRLLAIIVRDYLIAGPRRTLETLRFAVHDSPEDKLSWISAPGLVVRGANDRFVSQEWAEELARRLPHGQLVVIPNAAHGIIFSAANELVREIRRFLNQSTDTNR